MRKFELSRKVDNIIDEIWEFYVLRREWFLIVQEFISVCKANTFQRKVCQKGVCKLLPSVMNIIRRKE